VSTTSVKEVPAVEAAEALRAQLGGHKGDLTVADAAAKGGLSLRAAEQGLFALMETYPSNLRATDTGELLFSFPKGLDVPRQSQSRWRKLWKKVSGAARAAGRFILRAWISVVMIGYALLFLAIMIGLLVASLSGNRDGDGDGIVSGGGEILYVLFRVITEALFWTFHPGLTWDTGYRHRPARSKIGKKKKKDIAFYEKVNRFVFGPPPPTEDPRERERQLLAFVRSHKGRIGLTDVLRLTGLPREAAEPVLARLMLDYEGEVNVSDDGGITYEFPKLRVSAGATKSGAVDFELDDRVPLPALTGNTGGANFLVGALNLFNVVAAAAALALGITVADVFNLISQIPPQPDGIAWVLGAVPLFFSLAIFAMPLWRAFRRPAQKKKVAQENGRRALTERVLAMLRFKSGEDASFSEEDLKEAFRDGAGDAPSEKELQRHVVELGGDLDVEESGRALYRFRDLEAEVAALQAERAAADDAEMGAGQVVYAAEEVPR
jgi:hypothetical protein